MVVSPHLREQYFADGYYIFRGLLSQAQVALAIRGVQRLLARAKQPGGLEIPWIDRERDLPERLSGLLHPARFEPEFADHLENSALLAFIEGVLERPVRLSLFGMLAGGGGKPYCQGWHRDLGEFRSAADLENSQAMMRRAMQLNLPLYEDRFLQIVPGSHRRFTTDEEKALMQGSPRSELPGTLTVHLRPGDCAFYWPNLHHRGWNPEGQLRWTFHHALWDAQMPVAAHELNRELRVLDAFGPVTRRLMAGYLAQLPAGAPTNILLPRA